jgi:hypothetical protein
MRIRVGAFAGTIFALTLAAATSLSAQAATGSVCKDGTKSAATGQGACSNHGGVDAAATAAAQKSAKAEKSASKATAAAAKTTEKSAEKTTAKAAKTEAAAAKTEAKAETKAEKSTPKVESKAAKTESKAAEKSVAPTTKTSSTKADNTDPTNATAQCKDGTYSHAKNHQGACSNHGGVAKFLK